MRACCESTLEVLRNSGEVLVTIVEVLKHDPLHQWTLSPQQIARLQKSDEEEEDQLCEQVILRAYWKLLTSPNISLQEANWIFAAEKI